MEAVHVVCGCEVNVMVVDEMSCAVSWKYHGDPCGVWSRKKYHAYGDLIGILMKYHADPCGV